jgi:hypothetical protein
MQRPVFFLLTLALVASNLAAASPLDGVTLRGKTEIFIELLRSINSRTARQGDRFASTVQVPVTQDDKIVIPPGSYILGHVIESEGAGHLKGKGQLLLGFDTVILPDGTTREIRAALQNADKYSADPANEQGRIEAPGEQGKEVATGAAKGAATGVITGATIGVFRGQTLRGAGIGALTGAAAGALLGLLNRGEDVELPKGSGLTIQIQEDIEFVKPTPPPTGERLTP